MRFEPTLSMSEPTLSLLICCLTLSYSGKITHYLPLLVVIMSKSLSVTFRVPAELVESFTNAVSESGTDKTTWLVDAVRHKLSQPDSNPDHRMIALVERMEAAAAALIGGKQGIPPHPYNEDAVLQVVADTIKQGLDNGRVIAQRINEAGYQTRAGKAWNKDIYSAWKRQDDTATKIAAVLEGN